MRSSDYEFRVPDRLIPYEPPEIRGERRDHARMVVLHRSTGGVDHVRFDRLPSYVRPGDALVVNNSMLVNDQLHGTTRRGPVKVLLYGHHEDGWHVALSPDHGARGVVIRFDGTGVRAVLVKETPNGLWLARFEHLGSVYKLLAHHGERHQPLYGPLKDRVETYQNVYATEPGSFEIPSAGLHFTDELLDVLRHKGASIVPITLHIGLTEVHQYRRVTTADLKRHRVGEEWFRVPQRAAAAINRTRRNGGRIFAIGTSVVRTLETLAMKTPSGVRVQAGEGWTDLFIYPGHEYLSVDAVLTNLHEPRSTHLLLVAAFAGKEFTLGVYRDLVRRGYRFDLFGDSMLLL